MTTPRQRICSSCGTQLSRCQRCDRDAATVSLVRQLDRTDAWWCSRCLVFATGPPWRELPGGSSDSTPAARRTTR